MAERTARPGNSTTIGWSDDRGGTQQGDRPDRPAPARSTRPSSASLNSPPISRRSKENMSPYERSSLPTFLQAEEAGWEEVEGLVEALSPEQVEIPGYVPAWSVKDFLAHLAGWLAEAGQALERIRSGTFTDSDVDVDSRNDAFVDANRDQPLS